MNGLNQHLLMERGHDRLIHPRRYELETTIRVTVRTCGEGKCGQPATRVKGAYHVGPKRVRVWVCEGHANPERLEEVSIPAHVRAGIKADEEYKALMERVRLATPVHHSESVRELRATGSGEQVVTGSRSESFRWGETTGDLRGTLPLSSQKRS